MTNLNDDLKKLAMAGVGAASLIAEKAKEAVDELSKRGEETVAQGRELNEQLKHNVKEAVRENVTVVETRLDKEAVLKSLRTLTPEERAAIKQKIDELEKETNE